MNPVSTSFLNRIDNSFQDFRRLLQNRSLILSKSMDLRGQRPHAALAALHQQSSARRSRSDQRAATIVYISGSCHQVLIAECVHDARHGGRSNLLGGCEIAQGNRPSKHDD